VTTFGAESFPWPVPSTRLEAMQRTWAAIGRSGTWCTGGERVRFAAMVRAARSRGPRPPWVGGDEPADPLRRLADRIATDAGTIDRAWAAGVIGVLGDGRYVELVSVAASLVSLDVFCEACGVELEPLPEPAAGEPSRIRPDDVGDDGAYVPMTVPKRGANVARAMSLVPDAVRLFFGLEQFFYASGADFEELAWDRPLARPQVELLAVRASVVNECFY